MIIRDSVLLHRARESGKFLTELLGILREKTQPGVNLLELEDEARNFLKKNKIVGAFKGYQGFPANLCLSIDDCVVHGIPEDRELRPGECLKVDCGVIFEKIVTDSAFSKVVGGEEKNPQAAELIRATKDALDEGLTEVRHGHSLANFGSVVEESVARAGFSVLRNLSGHGVGGAVHEKPHVFNHLERSVMGQVFLKGQMLALEPITAITSREAVARPGNDWNLYTAQRIRVRSGSTRCWSARASQKFWRA